MADEWAQYLFDAEWGDLPLDILDTADNFSRVLARHEYPNVDGAVLRDRGGEPRETQCTIAFIPPKVLDRAIEFLALTKDGKTRRFTHPLFGSYMAKAENVRVSGRGEDRDYITIAVTFVEDASFGVTFADIAFFDIADAADVESAATDLDAAISTAGEDATTVGADSVALADSWAESTTLNARQINLELAEQSNAIQDAADAIDLATDVDNYPMMRQFTRLQNNLRNLAHRFISTAPKLTTYRVRVAQPLVAICQELYDASDAVAATERLIELNDIPNPARVETGRTLTVEVAA